jgi:hypothetical protein
MRGLKVAALFLVVALLLVWGCERKTTETIVASNQSGDCFTCHSDQEFALNEARTSYDLSLHATGDTYVRSGVPCANCHTNEGFINHLETGTSVEVEKPSHIACFTCHAPHTNGDLRLRTKAPVTLERGGATFDMGDGNLCANCHQARISEPDITGDSVTITSPYWGPHHGPQASVLSGNGAFLLTGVTSYAKNGHATAIANGCPQCHMASVVDGDAGQHSFNMTYMLHGSTDLMMTGCTCHPSMTEAHVDTVQTAVMAKIDSLHTLLVNAGLLTAGGQVNAPITVSADDAKVMYNFLLLEGDRSEGVHNLDYYNAVLDAAISYMNPPTL